MITSIFESKTWKWKLLSVTRYALAISVIEMMLGNPFKWNPGHHSWEDVFEKGNLYSPPKLTMVMVFTMPVTEPHNFHLQRPSGPSQSFSLQTLESTFWSLFSNFSSSASYPESIPRFHRSSQFTPPSSSHSRVFPKPWQGLSTRSPYFLHSVIHSLQDSCRSLFSGLTFHFCSRPHQFLETPLCMMSTVHIWSCSLLA